MSLVLLLLSAATGVHHVRVGSHCATTDVGSLTSVTMDICLAKQGFPFGDPTLLQLTSHLGGGSAILRVGGSDQNSFFYDMASEKSEPFSAKSGGKCCSHRGSCHGCANDCTMPQKYWKSITTFANASGHRLMFGLVPEVDQATALVTHSAQNGLPVHAFTFGNEKDDAGVIAGYQPLRKLLDDKSLFPAAAPLLAGPDVAMQRHDTIEAALAGADASINDKLDWVENFTAAVASTLDVVSWHTYDFHSSDIGVQDHATLQLTPETERFWSTEYLDMALRLNENITSIARRNAPGADVWLSESDSICHQGIDGITNAYLNSVWLVNRLGMMANANVSVMARQSLIGYNYSLLGNWPVEPIKPNPDYYTTVLFKRLFSGTVLKTTVTSSAATSAATSAAAGGTAGGRAGNETARAFAFCAAHGRAGAIALALVNFDANSPATFYFGSPSAPIAVSHREYILSPGGDPVVASVAWSSREMLLNGEALAMGGPGGAKLPEAVLGPGRPGRTAGAATLGPLSVGFVLIDDAANPDCK